MKYRGELKPLLAPEPVMECAMRYCDLAVAEGLLSIRCHVVKLVKEALGEIRRAELRTEPSLKRLC